jgi:hypothetical protein
LPFSALVVVSKNIDTRFIVPDELYQIRESLYFLRQDAMYHFVIGDFSQDLPDFALHVAAGQRQSYDLGNLLVPQRAAVASSL